MIITILCFVLLLCITLPIGRLVRELVQNKIPQAFQVEYWIIDCWFGLGVCASVALLTSCIMPTTVAWPSIVAFALACSIRHWKLKKMAVFQVLLSMGIAAAAIYRPITWFDSSMYHQLMIRWLHEYGVVPGMAHLGEYMGFLSGWYALQSMFSWERGLVLMNGFALFLCLAHLVDAVQKKSSRFLVVGYCIIIPMCLWWRLVNSPSADFPVIILIMLTAFYAIQRSPIIAFGLAFVALSMKLTALPLLGVACISLYNRTERRSEQISNVLKCARSLFPCLLLGAVLLIPFGIATGKATGWPFYPVKIAPITTDYAFSSEKMDFVRKELLLESGWRGFPAAWEKEEASKIQHPAYLWATRNRVTAASLALIFILTLLSLGSLKRMGYGLDIAVLWACIVFLFCTNPSWRFVSAYLVPIAALLWLCRTKYKNPLWHFLILSGVIVFMGAWPFKKSSLERQVVELSDVRQPFGLPYTAPYQVGEDGVVHPLRYRIRQEGPMTFYVPESTWGVWAEHLTAGWRVAPGTIELRDPAAGFESGFRQTSTMKGNK